MSLSKNSLWSKGFSEWYHHFTQHHSFKQQKTVIEVPMNLEKLKMTSSVMSSNTSLFGNSLHKTNVVNKADGKMIECIDEALERGSKYPISL